MASESRGLATHSLVDALTEALRSEILSGELVPGAAIAEQELARRYAVARPTAKAAIERLVQSGVLRRSSNRTVHVPQPTPQDIADLYLARILLERQAVTALALRRYAPDSADAALEMMMATALSSASPMDQASADILFHRSLVDGVGSERLSRMFRTVAEEAHFNMALEQSRSTLSAEANFLEHRDIIDAIRDGDASRARTRLTGHLRGAADRLLAAPLVLADWLDLDLDD